MSTIVHNKKTKMNFLSLCKLHSIKYRKFITFSIVGALNTIIHASIVMALVSLTSVSSTIANVGAFFGANIFSYVSNTYITFNSTISISRYIKFLSASLTTLLIIISISGACELIGIDYRISLVVVLLLSPFISFLLIKNVVFQN